MLIHRIEAVASTLVPETLQCTKVEYLRCALTPCNVRLEMVQCLCGIRWVQKLCFLECFLLHVPTLDLQAFYPSPVTLSLPHLSYTRHDESVVQPGDLTTCILRKWFTERVGCSAPNKRCLLDAHVQRMACLNLAFDRNVYVYLKIGGGFPQALQQTCSWCEEVFARSSTCTDCCTKYIVIPQQTDKK